jgi:signal transduction histidine kinase
MKDNLEAAHAAGRARIHLQRPPKIVEQPTEESANPNPPVQKAVSRRSAAAEPKAQHTKPAGQGLRASLQWQKHLRRMTHRVLVAHEDERLKLSHELQDEIAQTLLGINVRLLLLKQAARSKAKGLKNEIASTQRLVVRSAALVRRLARDLGHHQPTPPEFAVMSI